MKDTYTGERRIGYTEVDRSGRLGVLQIPMIMQDVLTAYFGQLGASNDILRRDDHAAWVLSKSRIRVGKLPFWDTTMRLEAYCVRRDAVRVNAEVKATDEKGNLAFVGTLENCAMDLDSRKLRRIDSVSFPQKIALRESEMADGLKKLRAAFSETDRIGEITVNWYDIDFTEHTNNTRYVEYLLRTLSADFLNGIRFTEIALNYLNESREGDILSIYRTMQDGVLEFLIKKGDLDVMRARMNYAETVVSSR